VGALLGSNQLHVSLLRCKPLLCTLCKMERMSSNIIQFLLSWFVPPSSLHRNASSKSSRLMMQNLTFFVLTMQLRLLGHFQPGPVQSLQEG
jgi:hypothetical protein